MKAVQDSWQITVHIAHIRGLNPGSARFDDSLSVSDRNHFRNLVLLCKPHHTPIDSKKLEDRYTVELLVEWKTKVEGSYATDLDELDWLDEPKLKELMASAISRTHREIVTGLEQIGTVGSKTLELVKEMVAQSIERPYIDPDALESLDRSTTILAKLPDHADMLSMSTNRLHHLPDSAEMLLHSTRSFADLAAGADNLLTAAKMFEAMLPMLKNLSSQAEVLSYVAPKLSALESDRLFEVDNALERTNNAIESFTASFSDIYRIEEVTAALNDAAENARDAAVQSGHESYWSWDSFRWGMGVAIVLCVAILVLYAIGAGR